MKEAPKFDSVLLVILQKPGIWQKLLIGGLLSFIPVINLLAFGYLMRVCRECRRQGVVLLPEWTDWKGLFRDGLRFALVWLFYWLLPIYAVFLLGGLLELVGFGLLRPALQIAGLIAGSVFLCAGLYRFQRHATLRENVQDLLEVFLILRMARGLFPSVLVAVLAAVGLAAIFWPFYGLAFFFSLLPLIVYSTLYFRWIEEAAVGRVL